MKTRIYIILACVILLGACKKMLDIQPTDSISSEDAIKDKSGVEKAITGAYDALQNAGLYGRNRVILGDLAADNLVWSGTSLDYAQIYTHKITIDNGIIDGMWTGAYDGINRVNNVLAALPGISDLTKDELYMYQGEALFLRALFNFNLLTYFGGVPIKTTPTANVDEVDQARNTPEEVYEQIISDLNAADTLLPDPLAMTPGKANRFSANALLSRVYLTRFQADGNPADANMAISKADTVLVDGMYSLPPYASLYEGEDNPERIFQVVFSAQDKNRLAEYFFPRTLSGRYEVAPSDNLISSYDPADTLRFKASIAFDTINDPYCIKYQQLTEGSDPVLVIRLAEMYLIKAEALAYTNGDISQIQQDINITRWRAGLQPTTAETYDDLKLAIENERRFEFAFEGHRWFDLVRTKRATAVLGIEEYQTLFPIPLSEMTTNKLMEQNPGY